MNIFFQFITSIIILIFVLWLISGAEVFNEINNECNNLTMSDCLNNKNCQYITNSKDFRLNKCLNVNIKKNGWKSYKDDDYTRALIANDNLYRDINKSVFD